jgi:hypothetical protein
LSGEWERFPSDNQKKTLNNNQKFFVPKIDLTKNDFPPKFSCWINGGDQITINQKIENFWGWQKKFGHLILGHQTGWQKNFIIKINLIEKKLLLQKNLYIHFNRWNWCVWTYINMRINTKWAHHIISDNLEIHYGLGLLIQKNVYNKHFGH